MINDHKVDIMIIQEVKINKHNFDWVVGHILQVAKYTYTKTLGASRGIATMWNPDKLNEVELHYYPHFLVVAFFNTIIFCILFNFYGPNTRGKLQVWVYDSLFIKNCNGYKVIWMKEYNTPFYPLEKLGGLEDFSRIMHVLDEFLRKNDLLDMDLQGVPFT